MKRTKEWWSMLNKGERAVLVGMERADGVGGSSAYLPVGYSDCGWCSTPTTGGLCGQCLRQLIRMINKPERMMIRRRAETLTHFYRDSITKLPRKLARRFVREMMCDRAGRRYTGIKRYSTVYMDALSVLVFHPALKG